MKPATVRYERINCLALLKPSQVAQKANTQRLFAIFLLSFLSLLHLAGNAQWQSAIYYNPYYIQFNGYGDYRGVDFVAEDTGAYCYSHYYSPSSGTDIWNEITTNGGVSWTKRSIVGGAGMDALSFRSVRKQKRFYHFANDQGFLRISTSSNLGVSWRSYTTMEQGDFGAFAAIDTAWNYFLMHPWTQDGDRIFRYTTATGYQFVDTFPYPEGIRMSFPSLDTGYIVSADVSLDAHWIYKTVDGGHNWNLTFQDSSWNIYAMTFIDNNTGWISGGSGQLMKTTDGGNNWTPQNSGVTAGIHSLFFFDDQRGYLCGNSGTIRKTTDGGQTWTPETSGFTLSFLEIYFVNDSVGYAETSNKSVYKTGGSIPTGTWEPIIPEENGLKVYPNPSYGEFNIESESIVEEVKIYDGLGRLVFAERLGSSKSKLQFSPPAEGVYFLQMRLKGGEIQTQQLRVLEK